VKYTGDFFTNNIPYLTNYTSLNGANATQSIALNYQSFTPASGTEGITFVTVYNAKTGAVVYGDEFLDPSVSASLIPAGTLQANTLYDIEIDFSDRIGGQNRNGNFTELGFDVRTDGSFTTAVAAVPEPSTWAMMVLGFAGISAMTYRRRRVATA
jgi:hypothetical protein